MIRIELDDSIGPGGMKHGEAQGEMHRLVLHLVSANQPDESVAIRAWKKQRIGPVSGLVTLYARSESNILLEPLDRRGMCGISRPGEREKWLSRKSIS